MLRLILPGLLILAATAAAGESTTWPMRWRTWCDPGAGIAFRHPYCWLPDQMHDWSLDRERGGRGGTVPVEIREITVDGKKMQVSAPTAAAKPTDLPHDIVIFSEVAAGAIDAVGDKAARIPLQWSDWDYYRADPARPHADAKVAPAGITARLGVGKDRCVLAVRHGERISGLVFAGTLDREHTRAVMDSFEILAVPAKMRRNPRAMTWREQQFQLGTVLDADGRAIAPPTKAKPVPWAQCWEIETEHYHVTGHTSPARLLQHGAYLEALYATYADLYEPDRMPPLKFEVHIFDLYRDFQAAAAAFGIPIGTSGGITGGFFTPSLLSLWVYEESGKLGGYDFTVEHVIAHECSHQFLHLACNGSRHVPTWFNEGLAVYFESGEFKNGVFQIKPPRERMTRLQAQYGQSGRMLMPPDWYLDHHGRIDAAQYAEVYAMVHFWVFGQCKGASCKHKDCGRSRFRTYWQALRGGEDGTEAFQRIFLDDMITAQGGKQAALKAWHDAMVAYVKKMK